MNLNHEIKMYRARVAHAAEIPSKDFTDDENLLIENCYHYNEAVDDAAYMIVNFRSITAKMNGEVIEE